ncbi:hypothetical protein AHAS_Ahas09G0202600 [Arachis hypogaea]
MEATAAAKSTTEEEKRKTRSRERGRGGALQLRYTAASPSSPPLHRRHRRKAP